MSLTLKYTTPKHVIYEEHDTDMAILSVCSSVIRYTLILLLARLMGRIVLLAGVCRRLSSSSVVVCNAAGGRAGRQPGAWTVGAPAAGA